MTTFAVEEANDRAVKVKTLAMIVVGMLLEGAVAVVGRAEEVDSMIVLLMAAAALMAEARIVGVEEALPIVEGAVVGAVEDGTK